MCLWCCRPQYPAGLPLLLAARDWFVSPLHPTIRSSQYSMFGLTVHAVENWKDPQPDVLLYIVFPARTEGTHVFTICFWHPELKLGKWSWNSARSQTTHISNLSEVAELSSFCKSTSNNSTRLQRDPAKVFNCGGEVTSGGGVSVDIRPLGCGAFRVWIQPTTEMIHSNIPTDVKVAHQFHLWMEPGRIFWDAT